MPDPRLGKAPTLRLRGARHNNLHDVSLALPLGHWIAVTGPSGSGKTSLVFDTLVAEGQRRFLGSLSPRARQYFGKLARARGDAVTGLPAAIAVGQRTATAHSRSTVGTMTGTLDLLRLLFARAAQDPGGTALSRSHFSFNHPLGACEHCSGLGVSDRVEPALLVADPSKSIRQGALVPTLRSGYTVYSQVTLEVMDQICQAHGFSVDTVWSTLTDVQRDVVFNGTRALKVPFGKHSIESRMRWKGITARPREEGFYRGLVPVIAETLARNRNPGVLRFVRSVPCEVCGGSRLARPGREALLGGATLPELLALPIHDLVRGLDAMPESPVLAAVRASADPRLRRMTRLGLEHLSLDRQSATLSGGESQRIQLAAQLTAGLSGLLVALDEPTLGLHPSGHGAMAEVLDELVALGNTLVVVEHDPEMVRRADHLVGVGPGAGPHGGRVTFNGVPPDDPLGPPPKAKAKASRRPQRDVIVVEGATLHNLDNASLHVRLRALNVVVGPSGAGKSSLVFGTLLPALSGDPTGGPFTALHGAVPGAVASLDARPIGRTPRSTPATYSGLFDLVRARFAATPEAKARRFGPGRFSYNNKEGRCPECEGLGVQRIGLHLLADASVRCAACDGGRYAPQTLEVTWLGRTVAEVLAMSVSEACVVFADDEPLAALCSAMETLGLGYLQLGQSSASLSRGEAQRVRLATLLGRTAAEPTLLLLDEPDRGLHPTDLARLLSAIDALIEAGHTVVAISHHRHLWAAADYLTEVKAGTATQATLPALTRLSRPRAARAAAAVPDAIELTGVGTHGLRDVDVRIPHRALTVLCGVSGSGKTSLAFHTLAAEAWHRFAESLPFAVRRFVRQMPRPSLTGASGLSPTLALRQGGARAGSRSTVATLSEVGPVLRLLWSRAGSRGDKPSGLSAEHFSPDRPYGACLACDGSGTEARCSPEALVTDPERPLLDGAMAGTRPGRFFGEPEGQYIATLQAALAALELAPDLAAPWNALPDAVRHVALHGAGERVLQVRWQLKEGSREQSDAHEFEGTWDGLCTLVEREAARRAKSKRAAEWAEPLVEGPCPACNGERLAPDVAAVAVDGVTLPALLEQPLAQVAETLRGLAPESDVARAALAALLPEITGRVTDLCELGLGHLTLSRRTMSLSDGELARTRLASVLRSGLTGLTLVLDEPGAGLHPVEVGALVPRLQALRDAGNTIIVVSHRPELIEAADHVIDMGPGAGVEGGQIVAQGDAKHVLAGEGPTAVALRGRHRLVARKQTQARSERVVVRGAHAHNLQALDLELPASGFVAVTGRSGSGKSSFVFDVLEASARAGRAVGCRQLEGLDRFVEVRSGRGPGTGATPLSALRMMPQLQRMFAGVAAGSGLAKAAFSYLSPAGRCETCRGTGRHNVSMDFLADLALPCPACGGERYRPEVLDVRWEGHNVAEVLALPTAALRPLLPAGKLRAAVDVLIQLGLGHVGLGRHRNEMSGGEAQRLTLAASLLSAPKPSLYLLDEPATGLHEADLETLARVLETLASRGDLVVAAEHRTSLVRRADWVVDLGPGGGPQGGRVVDVGHPADLRQGATAASLQTQGAQG